MFPNNTILGRFANHVAKSLAWAMVLICSSTFGQGFSVKNVESQLQGLYFTSLITEDSSNVYFVLANKDGYWSFGGKHEEAGIFVCPPNLQPTGQAFIHLTAVEKLDYVKPVAIAQKHDSLVLFATQKRKTSQTAAAYMLVVSKKNGGFRKITLSTIAFTAKDPDKEADFVFSAHQVGGRTYYLFVRNHQADWGLGRFVDVKLFDQELGLMYADTHVFPYNSMDCEVLTATMNGLGELVFLLRLESELGNFSYRAFVLNPATSASFTFPLDSKTWDYTAMFIASSRAGSLLVYGTGKAKHQKAEQRMVFGTLLSVDTRSIIQNKVWELGSIKLDKSNELSIRDLYPESASFISDSVYWISCQLKKKRTSTITDGEGKMYLQLQFRYEDAICFSNSHQLQSKTPFCLPLHQESRVDDVGLGVATMASIDSVSLVFNSHTKNFGLPLGVHQKVFNGKGCPVLVNHKLQLGSMQTIWPDKQDLKLYEDLDPKSFYLSSQKRWYFAKGTHIGFIKP
jgi:hypothetical protein